MCVPIWISIGTKLTNLENMQKSYVLFDVTYVMAAGYSRYFHQHTTSGYGSNSCCSIFDDIDLDL